MVERGRERHDFLVAFVVQVLDAAIKRALVAFGFAAAQVRFADVCVHDLAGRGQLEPLGSRFVCLDFWHGNYSDFRFRISDFQF